MTAASSDKFGEPIAGPEEASSIRQPGSPITIVSRWTTCPRCIGAGNESNRVDNTTSKCPRCGGSGMVARP